MKMQKKRYVLKFPPQSGDQPFSYHLVKDFDIRINILRAEVWPGKPEAWYWNWKEQLPI